MGTLYHCFVMIALVMPVLFQTRMARALEPIPAVEGTGRKEFSKRIIGGHIVDPLKMEFPWIASLQLSGAHICGGTLINPHFILTAAHCLEYPIDTAVFQRYDLTNPFVGQSISIVEAISHPNYVRFSGQNDVALFRLAEPVENIPLVYLNGLEKLERTGTIATTVGWGSVRENSWYTSTDLKKVDLPLVDHALCRKQFYHSSFPSYTFINEGNICAGYRAGKKDACSGDSGGPLLKIIQGIPVQFGIVSWGEGCARPNIYGVYARVSQFISWVRSVIDSYDIQYSLSPVAPFPNLTLAAQQIFYEIEWCKGRSDTSCTNWRCIWAGGTCKSALQLIRNLQYPTPFPTRSPTMFPTEFPTGSPTELPTRAPSTQLKGENDRCRKIRGKWACRSDNRCYWIRSRCRSWLFRMPNNTWRPTTSPTFYPTAAPTYNTSLENE